MNLTIKDLSASTELDQAAMTTVHGASRGNSAVSGILQGQDVFTPVNVNAGHGSASNVFVDVDANQSASESTRQDNGNKSKLEFALGLDFARRLLG